MAKKKPKEETIKLPANYVQKARDYKKATGVTIVAFICQAIDEKLNNPKA